LDAKELAFCASVSSGRVLVVLAWYAVWILTPPASGEDPEGGF